MALLKVRIAPSDLDRLTAHTHFATNQADYNMPSPPIPNIESLVKTDLLANETPTYTTSADASSNAYAYMAAAAAAAAEGIASVPSHVLPVVSPYDPPPNGVLATSHMTQQLPGVTAREMDEILESMQQQATAFPNSFGSSQSTLTMGGGNDDMQGIVQIKPEPVSNANSPSSNPSLVASPAPPQYANTSNSALSSALDEQTAAQIIRSRSGSLVSPGGPSTAVSNRTSPPREPAFTFGPADFQGMNSRPDPVNAPHMLAVDEVLVGWVSTFIS